MQVQPSVYSTMPMQTVAIIPPPPPPEPGRRALRSLSIIQIVIGILVIFCGILVNGLLDHNDPITAVGGPIWGGCWIMVTGIIGISFPRSGLFIAFNIISAVVGLAMAVMFGIGGVAWYSDCFMYWRYDDYTPVYNTACKNAQDSGIALYIILLNLMSIEFFISIIAAAFSCKHAACCCPQRNRDNMTQQMILPSSQVPYSEAYHPTSGYPQHTRVMTFPGQMVSQPPAGWGYVTAQGQQMPAQTYSSQMVSQPPVGGAFVSAQGQMMPVQTYSSQMVSQPPTGVMNNVAQGQQMPAQTNIVYSAQPTDTNTAPPPYVSKDLLN